MSVPGYRHAPVKSLGPEGSPYTVLKLVLEADTPEGGGCTDALLTFVDGMRSEVSRPITTIVVENSVAAETALCEARLRFCSE